MLEAVTAIHGLARITVFDLENSAGMMNAQVGHFGGRSHQDGRRDQSRTCFIRASDQGVQPARLENNIIVYECYIVGVHIGQRRVARVIGSEESIPADVGMPALFHFLLQDAGNLARRAAIDIDHFERRIRVVKAGFERHLRLFEALSG